MHDGETVRRGYVVHGRVQGVGFRWWTREICVRLGLGGHVRNLRDGTVEVHVVGPADRVAEFEQLVEQGPPSALVREVTRVDCDARATADRFEMERW